MTERLTIGKLATSAGVSVETVRFYERKGLIEQPQKTGGFRYYPHTDINRIKLVKHLQGIGFTLDEVTAFLAFDAYCGHASQLIKQKSHTKIAELQAKIADLNVALLALQQFADACGSHTDSQAGCDLLHCFENQWACCSGDTEHPQRTVETNLKKESHDE